MMNIKYLFIKQEEGNRSVPTPAVPQPDVKKGGQKGIRTVPTPVVMPVKLPKEDNIQRSKNCDIGKLVAEDEPIEKGTRSVPQPTK